MLGHVRWLRLVTLGCCLWMWTGTVQARSDVAAARAKFQEGQKLYESFDFAGAAQLFREAYDLSPNWRLLYNMAQAEAAARNYGPALQYFEQYLSLAGDDVPLDRKDEVIEEIRRMRDMVAFVEIEAPHGCEVRVNEVERGQTPLSSPLIVNAGVENVIVVRQGERELLRQTIQMSSQQTRTLRAEAVSVETAKEPQVEPPEPQTEDPEPTDASSDEVSPVSTESMDPAEPVTTMAPGGISPATKAGAALLGIGAASGIVGMVTGIAALRISKDMESSYGLIIPPTEEDRLNRMNNLAVVANITLIAGGTLAVTGAVLRIAGRRKSPESLVRLTPVVGQGEMGLRVERRF